MANKIKYGLKNVHIASCTEALSETTGAYTYTFGEFKSYPGAVSVSLSAEGDSTDFYADDSKYFHSVANNGYSGTLEMAYIPDWFRTAYLSEATDKNGAMFESADVTEMPKFAMAFEFSGDANKVRHLFYVCSVSRPDVAGNTKESSVDPQTETLNIVVDPRKDDGAYVKAKCEATDDAYSTWFNAVYEYTNA